MSNHIHEMVKTSNAVMTANLDQIQAFIDETRQEFPDDDVIQKMLDERQAFISMSRFRIETRKMLLEKIEPYDDEEDEEYE